MLNLVKLASNRTGQLETEVQWTRFNYVQFTFWNSLIKIGTGTENAR